MITLPKRGRGRPTAAKQAKWEAEVQAFCEAITEINWSLDFKISSRGWCYILEEHGLTKGDFDKAQTLITDCRKQGLLSLDIVAEDQTRSTDHLPRYVDDETPEEKAHSAVEMVWHFADNYAPAAFWGDRDIYVEMLVEKVDLKNLFGPVCARHHVPISNAKGWTDLNLRAAMMRRFQRYESEGKQCVLLYCGDHDPGGLAISHFLRSNMQDLSEAVHWEPSDLVIERFGLNHDFIGEQGLTWIDNLETSSGDRLDDPKHKDHFKPYVQDYIARYGARKVEANALVVRPEAGRELCRETITRYVNPEWINEYSDFLRHQRSLVRDHVGQALRDAADRL